MKISMVVLAVCFWLAAPSLSIAKSAPAITPATMNCTGHGDGMTMDQAETTPLFALMRSKLGNPTACALEQSDDNVTLTVTFAHGATLAFLNNQVLELATEEATLPAGAATVSRDEVVKALKATEKEGSPKGLGVNWTRLAAPVPAGSVDIVAEGKTCNAKAHVQYQAGLVVGFGFSTAC
jgi:hypothetical protein